MQANSSIPLALRAAFCPLHRSAFGLAVGLVGGFAVVILTAFHVLVDPISAPPLGLLTQFFYGYSVSWAGALIGFFWSLVIGFVMGWLVAFVRNLVIAVWIAVVKARAELTRASDFIGHV